MKIVTVFKVAHQYPDPNTNKARSNYRSLLILTTFISSIGKNLFFPSLPSMLVLASTV